MGCLVGCYVASFIGSEGAFQGLGTWYLVINRPRWAPQIWLFSPLWTALYGFVAIAGWMAYREARSPRVGFWFYWSQLVLGALWPWLFFARHLLMASCVDLVLQWALLFAATLLFLRARPAAGLLLVPYLGWVAFAAALSVTILKTN